MTKRKPKKNRKQSTPSAHRRYKDQLFRFIFQEKQDLLELYNAVNGTDYQNPQELIINTLEDVVYIGMKNDISFLIGGTMNLYEHQSSRNPNMPLRGLLYFARIYDNYVEEHQLAVHSSVLQHLLLPRYLIFYNGSEGEPDKKELSLQDAFTVNSSSEMPCLDCRATLLNINYGHNKDLMKKCRKLEEYAIFVETVREMLLSGMDRDQAVHHAVDECIRLGVLKDILTKNRNEVVDMILTTFNQELHDKTEREAAYLSGKTAGKAEGKIEGRAEGKAEIIAIIRKKLQKEMSTNTIAEILELNKNDVKRIASLIEEDRSRTDLQIAEILLR